MNSAEQEAFEQLQQAADKSDAQHQLSGWVVRTGRQGVYYLHENSSLSFQTLGAARVAVHALEQSEITGTGHDYQEDDEDELVEPLLPRAWRKELDRQKALKDDVDTDLYAVNIAEQDIAQAPEEEGSPVGDDFVILEGPQMAKLSLCCSKFLML